MLWCQLQKSFLLIPVPCTHPPHKEGNDVFSLKERKKAEWLKDTFKTILLWIGQLFFRNCRRVAVATYFSKTLRARSWRQGKGSSAGLLPSPAHLPPVAAQFVSSPAHACIQGELVVADACAGCMGSGECVHLNLKAYGMLCFVFSSWIIAYGIHLLYLLTVDCLRCLKTHRVWSQGSSVCVLRWVKGCEVILSFRSP